MIDESLKSMGGWSNVYDEGNEERLQEEVRELIQKTLVRDGTNWRVGAVKKTGNGADGRENRGNIVFINAVKKVRPGYEYSPIRWSKLVRSFCGPVCTTADKSKPTKAIQKPLIRRHSTKLTQ